MGEYVPALRVRALCKEDVPHVLAIDRALDAPDVWDDAFVYRFLTKRNHGGLVAQAFDAAAGRYRVAGFALYQRRQRGADVKVWHLAVDPAHRRQKVGARLVDRLKSLARDTVCACLRESNLPGQLFLRATGFRCATILKREKGFDCPPENAFYFLWRKP